MDVTKKATAESVGSGSTLALGEGSKRAAMSGGYTPASKKFHCAWVPWHVEWFSCFFFLSVCTLFDWNFSLFNTSASGELPPPVRTLAGSGLGAGRAHDAPECCGH
jgi:hypothetical protein